MSRPPARPSEMEMKALKAAETKGSLGWVCCDSLQGKVTYTYDVRNGGRRGPKKHTKQLRLREFYSIADKGEGVPKSEKFADVICVWPLSMYTIGFCESLFDMLHQYIPDHRGDGGDGAFVLNSRINDVRLVGFATVAILLVIAIVGMNVVSRVQIGLLVLLVLAQVDHLFNSFMSNSIRFTLSLWSSGYSIFNVRAPLRSILQDAF